MGYFEGHFSQTKTHTPKIPMGVLLHQAHPSVWSCPAVQHSSSSTCEELLGSVPAPWDWFRANSWTGLFLVLALLRFHWNLWLGLWTWPGLRWWGWICFCNSGKIEPFLAQCWPYESMICLVLTLMCRDSARSICLTFLIRLFENLSPDFNLYGVYLL